MRFSERITKATGSSGGGRISGTVAANQGQGVYIVRTGSGARIRAESDVAYEVGARVTVLQGRILGRTGGNAAKVVEV